MSSQRTAICLLMFSPALCLAAAPETAWESFAPRDEGTILRDPNGSDLKALPWASKRASNATPLPSSHPDRTASVAKSIWDHPAFTVLLGVLVGAISTGILTIFVDGRRRKVMQKAVGEAILAELRLCFRNADSLVVEYERLGGMGFKQAVSHGCSVGLPTTLWHAVESLPQNIPAEHLERLCCIYHGVELTRSVHERFRGLCVTWKGRFEDRLEECCKFNETWPDDMIHNRKIVVRLLRGLAKWHRDDLSLTDLPDDDVQFLGLHDTGGTQAEKPTEASEETGSEA